MLCDICGEAYEQLFKDIADLDFQQQYDTIQAYALAHKGCGCDKDANYLATDDNFIRWAVRNYDNIMALAQKTKDYNCASIIRRPNAV